MSITVTEAASKKVRELIDEEENQELKLRVFVTGGGCSGFQYGFTFDENQKDNDMSIEQDGVKILIDSLSFQYLMGSEVDYTEGLQGSRFIINNPQAKTTCGCGSSFSI
jgi:iron-sulfur cluster insertion protein